MLHNYHRLLSIKFQEFLPLTFYWLWWHCSPTTHGSSLALNFRWRWYCCRMTHRTLHWRLQRPWLHPIRRKGTLKETEELDPERNSTQKEIRIPPPYIWFLRDFFPIRSDVLTIRGNHFIVSVRLLKGVIFQYIRWTCFDNILLPL